MDVQYCITRRSGGGRWIHTVLRQHQKSGFSQPTHPRVTHCRKIAVIWSLSLPGLAVMSDILKKILALNIFSKIIEWMMKTSSKSEEWWKLVVVISLNPRSWYVLEPSKELGARKYKSLKNINGQITGTIYLSFVHIQLVKNTNFWLP